MPGKRLDAARENRLPSIEAAILKATKNTGKYRIDGKCRLHRQVSTTLRGKKRGRTVIRKPTYDELADKSRKLEQVIAESGYGNKVEEKLDNAVAGWQAAFNAFGDVTCLIDNDFKIIRCNKAAETFFKMPLQRILGQFCWKIVHGAEAPRQDCPLARMKKSMGRETCTLQIEDRWYEITVDPILNENHQVDGAVHILRDVTEKKRSEAALRDSEAQKQALLDASIDSIRLVDKDLRIIWANKIVERQIKVSQKNIVGNYCYQIFTGRSHPCPNCPAEKSRKSGKIEHSIIIEENVKGIPGTSYWADYALPIKDEFGQITSFIQVSRDITAIKKAEVELVEEKDKLVNALAKVRTLSGLLPICSICKKIRDDRGYWNQLEAFIEDHSEAEFSHGICNECAQKYYPDLDVYND